MTLKATIYECEICGEEFRLEEDENKSRCACAVADHAETDRAILVAIFMRIDRNMLERGPGNGPGWRAFDLMMAQPNPMHGVAVCHGCKMAVRAALAVRAPKVAG